MKLDSEDFEVIYSAEECGITRMPVPGGWIYHSMKALKLLDGGHEYFYQATFVPDPHYPARPVLL